VHLHGPPCLRVLLERDLAGGRVDPPAAQNVGLGEAQPGQGVRLGLERVGGVAASAFVPVAGLVAAGRQLPGVSAGSSEGRGKDGRGTTWLPSSEVKAAIAAADARRRAENLDRDRARTHNPIGPEEVAGLERLGAEIRRLRLQAGLTISELAELADRHSSFVARIERGSRRARLDTLRAIAGALASRGVGTEAGLTALFAGQVVAPESVWSGWPERMAKRRAKKKRREELEARRHEAAVRRVWGDWAEERLGEAGGPG
jgi:transcriptional regulator with XRE-family HTH domain